MTEFAREYGEGLYELAAEEKLTTAVLDELKVLRSAFEEQPEFIKLLSNRALGLNERQQIIDNAFKGTVNAYIVNFLKLLCARDAMHEFSRCVQVYIDHFNLDNRVSAACVTTAKPLGEEQLRRLKEKLERMTGHEVYLTEKLDETLMGGVVLEMDGRRWDNSIKQRLETIRRDISGATNN